MQNSDKHGVSGHLGDFLRSLDGDMLVLSRSVLTGISKSGLSVGQSARCSAERPIVRTPVSDAQGELQGLHYASTSTFTW